MEEYDEQEEGEFEEETQGTTSLIGKLNVLISKLKNQKSPKKLKASKKDLPESIPASKETKATGFIQTKLPFLAKLISKKRKSELEVEKPTNTKERKKKKINIIHIVIILGVVAVLLSPDEKDETQVTDTKAKKVEPVKKEEPVAPEVVNNEPEQAPEAEVETAEPETETETETKLPPEETADPAKVTAVELKEIEVDETLGTEPDIVNKKTEPREKPVGDDLSGIDISNQSPTDEVEVEPEPEEQPVQEPEEATEVNTEISEPVSKATSADIANESNNSTAIESGMELGNQLLEKLENKLKSERAAQETIEVLEPTGAPSYEALGLALVYNCTDSHWACIDILEYEKCRKNYAWNKSKGIPIECYPFAKLSDIRECSVAQQQKIDSVSATSFCE